MKKIGVVGHFGGNKSFFDGQTIKTRNIYRILQDKFGSKEIIALDTYGYKKRCIPFFADTVKLIFTCKNVIIMPDENGIKVFMPLYCLLNYFLKRRIHYVVIGGWLPQFYQKHNLVKWFSKKITGIYVETISMKTALAKMGFDNVIVLPNMKHVNVMSEEQLNYNYRIPFEVCMFSRVMVEKGVEDAISVVKSINEKFGKIVLILDIYGQIDDNYKKRFKELQSFFPSYIRYKGTIEPDKSVETIKNYFALLFPTKFYTEGIPGTLIDACAAGVPVITSLWGNCEDVFKEGITGWGYEFDNIDELQRKLEEAILNPADFIKMKDKCLEEANRYNPETAAQSLLRRIE